MQSYVTVLSVCLIAYSIATLQFMTFCNSLYNTGSVCVCLYQSILLTANRWRGDELYPKRHRATKRSTAEPIWLSFTVLLDISHGKVYNYFGNCITTLPREIAPRKISSPKISLYFYLLTSIYVAMSTVVLVKMYLFMFFKILSDLAQ